MYDILLRVAVSVQLGQLPGTRVFMLIRVCAIAPEQGFLPRQRWYVFGLICQLCCFARTALTSFLF